MENTIENATKFIDSRSNTNCGLPEIMVAYANAVNQPKEMTETDLSVLDNSIDHIIESGVNTIRVHDLVLRYIERFSKPTEPKEEKKVVPYSFVIYKDGTYNKAKNNLESKEYENNPDYLTTIIIKTQFQPREEPTDKELTQMCMKMSEKSLAKDWEEKKPDRDELICGLAKLYAKDSLGVANVCDEVLDKSGALLGEVRRKHYNI